MLLVAEAVDRTDAERCCFADAVTEFEAVLVAVPECEAESVKERVPFCDTTEVRDSRIVAEDVLVSAGFLVGPSILV